MQLHPASTQDTSQTSASDQLVRSIQSFSRYLLIAVFGLIPILFVPSAFIPIGYGKTVMVVVGVLLTIVFFSLSILRSGQLRFGAPLALWAMWGVVGVAFISALISGDINDALFGEEFSVHSALFLGFLALISTIAVALNDAKVQIMRLYMFLATSTVVIGLYHILRLFFGSSFLTFGVFESSVASPIGGWNDLALFFGLSVILSIVALEQLPLPKLGRALFSGVIVVALIMLSAINFFIVWIVLALVSLITVVYGLSKDRFSDTTTPVSSSNNGALSTSSLTVSIGVFIVSLLFIIAGSTIGEMITNRTDISFVEVRPSAVATFNIAKEVYAENAFLGIGPNRFEDAWRLYKDRSINDTIFWDTNFVSGNGYLTTLFVTTGLFGVISWVVFLGLFVYGGFKMLFRSKTTDRFWYFIGTSSFAAALYLWGMAIVYVPGPAILMLAAVCTGMTFVAHNALIPGTTKSVSLGTDRRGGFFLIAIVMVLIVGSIAGVYTIVRNYMAISTFNEAVSSIRAGVSLREIETQMAEAFELSESDRFANQIALYQLQRMNSLLAVTDPTAEQQQQFQTAVTNGIDAAQRAIEYDDTNPLNWATIGSIYSLLAARNIEDAENRAREAFARAQQLSPLNPEYVLLKAQLESRIGNLAAAREAANEAVRLKPGYTNALLFLAELDIAEGNVTGAISRTLSLASLEPRNAARQYQLGILYSSNQQLPEAISAFERAVAIDGDYANARYLLALAYVEEERIEEAIAQLEVVRDLNPDNTQVTTLIEQLESGDFESLPTSSEVAEPAPLSETGDVTVPNLVPDSDLLTPVNTPGAESESPNNPESSVLDVNTTTTPEESASNETEDTSDPVTEPGA